MPSLPTSLIVVGLVIAWLVVLVPMVARRREQVPENTEESANFRVLQRDSSSSRKRRPVLSRTAMAHRSAGSSDAASEDDEPDSVEQQVRMVAEPDTGEWGSAPRQRAPEYDAARGDASSDPPDLRLRDNEVGERDYRRTPVRHGRGGFDPVASDQARAYRFRQRRRVALALLLIAAAGAFVGFVGSAYGYVAAVSGGVVLVLYLAYLRRQVRIENEIRRRRAARLARARQIRPGYRPSVAEQVYTHRTGETPRPGAIEEIRVTSHARQAVPPSGYGYGEPVDFEDSDPAFDDLEYYRPAALRRRAG